MATMQCDIVSAEDEMFSGEITQLEAHGTIGYLGIRPMHAPLLTGIREGSLILTLEDGSREIFYASGGFLEVQGDVVTVLADTALRAEDLDEAMAQEAKALAEKAKSDTASDIDFSVVAAQVLEAQAQLKRIEELRKLKR